MDNPQDFQILIAKHARALADYQAAISESNREISLGGWQSDWASLFSQCRIECMRIEQRLSDASLKEALTKEASAQPQTPMALGRAYGELANDLSTTQIELEKTCGELDSYKEHATKLEAVGQDLVFALKAVRTAIELMGGGGSMGLNAIEAFENLVEPKDCKNPSASDEEVRCEGCWDAKCQHTCKKGKP